MNSITARNVQLYTGGLRPNPGIPAGWPEAKQQRAREIHADVEAAFPGLLGAPIDGADYEDHFEDAARISAAWRATGGDLEMRETGHAAKPWTADDMARRLGPVTRDEEGGHHGADTLAGHELVRRYGGRGITIGSLNTAGSESDISTWLAARHREHGVARGIVKSMGRKDGIWSIELDSDPALIERRIRNAMDWTYVRLEGRPNAIMAQDVIEELFWEYRLFVVDGEVLSGAGCVEEFTPLDAIPGQAFDTRVRRVRGHLHQGMPSEVEDRPELVARLIDFGREVAREHGGTVVIDVALDAATDQPVVIEMNGYPNSGLYASDPWLVTPAIVWAMDRGYGDLTRTH